jgi:hypothetical protein
MNILVLHRIPYHKINYQLGIDHERHAVTYIGTAAALSSIPAELTCRKVERPGNALADTEVTAWMSGAQQRFDRVISLSEYELLDAARIRARFGIAGPSPSDAEKVRDKVIMKQAVASHGIAVPRFMSLGEFVESENTPWGGKTVLKPLDGASSEDVVIFGSSERLLSAMAFRTTGVVRLDKTDAELTGFEIEEFVEGPILHFDGLVNHGHLLVVQASRYIGTCLGYARGKPLGSYQIPLNDQTTNWVTTCLSAVEIDQGSFHLEAIESPRGLVFLEIANRVGGADVVDTFEMATGVHLPSEELKILLGEKVDLSNRAASDARFGWFVFPGHHLASTHCHLKQAESFARNPMMVRWSQLSPDRPLPRNITYQAADVPAAGVVRGSSSEAVADFMEKMFSLVEIVPVEERVAA